MSIVIVILVLITFIFFSFLSSVFFILMKLMIHMISVIGTIAHLMRLMITAKRCGSCGVQYTHMNCVLSYIHKGWLTPVSNCAKTFHKNETIVIQSVVITVFILVKFFIFIIYWVMKYLFFDDGFNSSESSIIFFIC